MTSLIRFAGILLVALVDQDHRFVGLIDRHALLDQMGKQQESGMDSVQEAKTS